MNAEVDGPGSRLERRKAKTRRALIDAALTVIADGRAESASIAEITSLADVGLGSFYNHFDDRSALLSAAMETVLLDIGDRLDSAELASDDPVLMFCDSYRRTGRIALSHRQNAEIIDRYGFALIDAPRGLGERAHRDLSAAVASGQLHIDDVALATSYTAGVLLALIHRWLAEPTAIGDAQIDESLEKLLTIFGVDPDRASHLSHLALDK